MQATRRARLESVIQQELSILISREIKDPRVPALTITAVQVTEDARLATIFIALLGGTLVGVLPTLVDGESPTSAPESPLNTPTTQPLDGEEELRRAEAEDEAQKERVEACLEGLNSASGFMRRHLAKVLTIRHVPTLTFREDRGFENATRVHALLRQLGSN